MSTHLPVALALGIAIVLAIAGYFATPAVTAVTAAGQPWFQTLD
jgi:hypothetical protein